jgi:cytochrome c oxidase subunit II
MVGEAHATPLSMLDPAGPGAAAITQMWWVMFWGGLVILAAVVALAVYPFLKLRGARTLPTGLFLWGGGLAFPIVVLVVLLAYALTTGQALTARDPDALRVEVRAHQWWWEFVYPDADGGPLYTAAELHVPAGKRVELHVTSDDVIHSFWVPRLGRKIDAIPGLTNVITLQADQPGLYWGQCSEFCGLHHAAMAFLVEAHAPQAFTERLAALAASTRDQAHPGSADFRTRCGQCHSTNATTRGGGAPNLAGLSERRRLGSGAMNFGAPEDLRRWLRDHETIKPGSRKPSHADVDDATLDRIVSFLAR